MDIDGKHEWRDCIEVPGVRLPRGYYFGTSSITGDLSGTAPCTPYLPCLRSHLHRQALRRLLWRGEPGRQSSGKQCPENAFLLHLRIWIPKKPRPGVVWDICLHEMFDGNRRQCLPLHHASSSSLGFYSQTPVPASDCSGPLNKAFP